MFLPILMASNAADDYAGATVFSSHLMHGAFQVVGLIFMAIKTCH
jgi:hypothetical protein